MVKLRFSNEWVMHNKKKYLSKFGQNVSKPWHPKRHNCINLNTYIDSKQEFQG
jgi:hypothetical protein